MPLRFFCPPPAFPSASAPFSTHPVSMVNDTIECCHCGCDIEEEEHDVYIPGETQHLRAVSCNEGHLSCYACIENVVNITVGEQDPVTCGELSLSMERNTFERCSNRR